MKLMTLNTHSLVEKDWEQKLRIVANAIITEEYDVVALQEVNQPINEQKWENDIFTTKYPLKNGNYMLKLKETIEKHSQSYKFIWCGFKESYGKYQEGIGIITKLDVIDIKTVELTSGSEREQWKKRCALGIKTPVGDFFSTHMGWWEDEDEPFLGQWRRLLGAVENKKTWILGDFNAESHKKNQSYDMVISDGFYDSFIMAEKRDAGFTVCNKIDGWQDGKSKRIDYIFSNFPAKIKYCETVFNGENYDVVSDHFGVAVETEV